MSTACTIFASRGTHSWTAAPGTTYDRNGDPNEMVCWECGVRITEIAPTPRLNRDTNWTTATAGYTFAPDVQSNGNTD